MVGTPKKEGWCWRLRLAVLSIGLVVLGCLLLKYLDWRYPLAPLPQVSTLVLADDGTPLRAFPGDGDQWRYPVGIDDISPHYLEVLLTYEDRWFYWHPGVNPFSLVRAFWQNAQSSGIVSGGSTLTMQVARLLHPHDRSYRGKLVQVLRAFQLEWHYSKPEIIDLYLNLAPFGGMLSGVQAASFFYFGKQANQLSDAEAALLAVLPQRPSDYRPDRHPQAALKARNKALARMAVLGVWSQSRVAEAQAEPLLVFAEGVPKVAPILSRRLYQQCTSCNVIHSTIDYGLQLQLEALVDQYLYQLSPEQSVAVMVMDNRDGSVKSYVGSGDFWSATRHGQVDMIQAVRSPGSTLKPFLYGMAIDEGLIHSHSLLLDAPRSKSQYRPHNFTGQFNGPVTATEALQRSLNVPAVQLIEFIEAGRFLTRLQHGGLKSFGPGSADPNPSVILGGVGVKMEQMVGLYSAFARQGLAIKPRLRPEQPQQERRLLSAGSAWIIWDALAQHPYRSMHQKTQGQWNLAWKTGTSYGYREAWAMGVSPRWTIGVWVGRPDGSPSPGKFGRDTAAPLLFRVHSALSDGERRIIKPSGVTKEEICWPSGTALTRPENQNGQCLRHHAAWVLEGVVPPTLHELPDLTTQRLITQIWVDPVSGLRVDPSCAKRSPLLTRKIALWPEAAEPWLPTFWRNQQRLPSLAPECALFAAEQKTIRITTWPDKALVKIPPHGGELRADLMAQGGSGARDWYVDGRYVGSSERALSYQFSSVGLHQISVVDEQGNRDMIQLTISQ